MERDEVIEWLRLNRKVMLIAGLGITLIGGLLLWDEGAPAAQSKPAVRERSAAALPETVPPPAPLMPNGFKPETALRDPFAPVAGGKNERAEGPPRQSGQGGPLSDAKKQETARPQLTGVASGNGRQVAIVSLRGESKALSAGERIGEYRLIQVTENGATVEGPGGTLLLRGKGE